MCQIPVSFDYYMRCRYANQAVTHCSSWGVWHFGILSGSENGELAAKLINHFMSSHKTREMASAGAIVPTLEDFYYRSDNTGSYARYADTCCLQIAERPDIKQPTTTYGQLYHDFFKNAKTRSAIFDYRHTMQELYAVADAIRSLPVGAQSAGEVAWLKNRVDFAFGAILGLRDMEMMVH